MAKRLVIGVDWFGPYTRTEVAQAEEFFEGGLYFAIGRKAGKGNHKRKPQYIGISNGGLCGRASNPAHHKLKTLDPHTTFWLGEIATAEPAGKRQQATRTTLSYAEWLHAYFMHLPLNEKKTKKLPPNPVTVLNRWWKGDFCTPYLKRPHPDWPDLIDFMGLDFRARKVWFKAPHQTVIPASELR